MKTTIETIEFPCEIKKKLKMKVSMGNLEVEFIDGHLIKFNKTNLNYIEPHRIIIKGIAFLVFNYPNDIFIESLPKTLNCQI